MKNYISAFGSAAKISLYSLVGLWAFVGILVLGLGMYPKPILVLMIAYLVAAGLFFYLITEVLKSFVLMNRFVVTCIASAAFIFLNIALIRYAVSINYNTIVNCGVDAHELFWSPSSSNCKQGFLYNINPFNPQLD